MWGLPPIDDHGALISRSRAPRDEYPTRAPGLRGRPSNSSGVNPRAERIEQRFELATLVAALLVIPTLIIESSDLGQPWDAIAFALNWATWLAFATEAS